MAATTKRHPSRTRHRTAVSKDGKILGGEIDFTIDGGAYTTLSPVVLSRGTIHAGGPYYWPAIRVRAKAVATNAPPHGAFRGFGAPQSLFAMERHMDRIAQVVGLSPVEIRRRNFLKPGQTTTTDQVINEADRSCANCSTARSSSRDYDAKKRTLRQRKSTCTPQKGNRHRRFSARRGIYRIGRALSELRGRRRSAAPMAASACSFPARNSARAPTPCSARSPPKLWAFPTKMYTSRSRTRTRFPTAAPRSRRAP